MTISVSPQELELRIDTQKQTLQSRDESIKKLLDMLQNKGVGELIYSCTPCVVKKIVIIIKQHNVNGSKYFNLNSKKKKKYMLKRLTAKCKMRLF